MFYQIKLKYVLNTFKDYRAYNLKNLLRTMFFRLNNFLKKSNKNHG